MKTLLAQDLGLIDLTGRRLHLSVALLASQYTYRQTWWYLVPVLIVLLAADPLAVSAHLPRAAYLSAWVFGLGSYFGSQVLLMLGIAALRRRLPRVPVYWPVVSFLALGPTLPLLDHVLKRGLGAAIAPQLLSNMFYLLVIAVMFETIFMRFVFTPEEAPEVPPVPKAAPGGSAPESRVLLIGAQPVPLGQLIYLEARQHHVCAALACDSLTLRSRLADVLAQTAPGDGVQTHRSWWVARRAIKGLGRQDGRPVVLLQGGGTVPVARGRLDEVERWCAEHLGGPE